MDGDDEETSSMSLISYITAFPDDHGWRANVKTALNDYLTYSNVKIEYASVLGYLNMKEVLKNYPKLTDYAIEAAGRAGVKAQLRPIRGGTDGSRLTAMGLPTPNLFTGGHNFHGKLEFNSRKGLEKSTETLVHLVQIWAEK